MSRIAKTMGIFSVIVIFALLLACTASQKSCTNPCDQDGDGFRAVGLVSIIFNGRTYNNRCPQVPISQRDCNDNDKLINPGATEICGDELDNNCNGIVDDGCTVVTVLKPIHEYDGEYHPYNYPNQWGSGFLLRLRSGSLGMIHPLYFMTGMVDNWSVAYGFIVFDLSLFNGDWSKVEDVQLKLHGQPCSDLPVDLVVWEIPDYSLLQQCDLQRHYVTGVGETFIHVPEGCEIPSRDEGAFMSFNIGQDTCDNGFFTRSGPELADFLRNYGAKKIMLQLKMSCRPDGCCRQNTFYNNPGVDEPELRIITRI